MHKVLLTTVALSVVSLRAASPYESRGRIHISIGVPNSLDTLKTYVEAEGNFSPGFGTFGVAFWVYDRAKAHVYTSTMGDVPSERGLAGRGWLIPWSEWRAADINVRTEVCEVKREWHDSDAMVVGSRIHLTNMGKSAQSIVLYVAVSPKGPAGASIHSMEVEEDSILVNDQLALVANTMPTATYAPMPDVFSRPLKVRHSSGSQLIQSRLGQCNAGLRYDVTLAPGERKSFGFICPVLHGRRAVRHEWDGINRWMQIDESNPILGTEGVEQPAPGVAYYRSIDANNLFAEAERLSRDSVGSVELDLPDKRWGESFTAIAGHASMMLNEGAPDLAVINLNVFNRGGVQIANVLQKSGDFVLAADAITYFLTHPFNGHVDPDTDNPGEIAWLLGEHWRLTRDKEWLERVWPKVQKLGALIEYCRTIPGPHWVSPTSLEFGEALPSDDRKLLNGETGDGVKPAYAEAFDIAGMRSLASLAEAMKDDAARDKWSALGEQFAKSYDENFGAELRKSEYTDYCALWPCHLYPLGKDRSFQFKDIGAQTPGTPRYFPLARAHQGLFAGQRTAGSGSILAHLELDSMRGWYAMDEGIPSGPGSWMKVLSNWKISKDGPGGADSAVAMPHGWAVAEFHLLMRDCLAFENDRTLVLFAGVPEEWFTKPMRIKNLPTYFGKLSVDWKPADDGGMLTFSGDASPPDGFILRAPGKDITIVDATKPVNVRFSEAK